MRTLIKDGTVVTATDTVSADVWIDGDTVVGVCHPSLRKTFAAEREIDATGKLVLPGGVDVHTHLDMPFMGTSSRDDFQTGTIAAAHGGTTCLVDFAIQGRGQSLRAGLDAWHAKAEGKAAIDYGFHMIMADVNPQSLAEMKTLAAEGVTSYKLFTAYPGALYSDDGQILRAMQQAAELGALVSLHAENGIAINVLIEQAVARGEVAPRFHAATRPEISEAEATHRALCLAEIAGAPVYIVHLTASRALEQIVAFRDRGLSVYAETCPQYLFCCTDDIAKPDFEGAKYVCSPPMRPKAMQADLWRGLRTGHVQVVATDHCPFDFKGQKDMGREVFTKIPNGMPAIETRLHLLWDGGVREGRITPSRFVDIVATAPAKLFGLYPKKGTVAVGSDADLVVWDPERKQSLRARDLHMRVDYSPYEGRTTQGAPTHVLSRGNVIVENGKFLGKAGAGRYLRRAAFRAL
ncbi:MAG: dihydropyrimidinase [Deltaproteobacteria bacterium]|nr:dihydropyrimidinase [Deltaproteobacteria bacterium]